MTVQKYFGQLFSVITHDNVNIRQITYAQRIGHNSKFDSGTAATVYFKVNASPLRPEQVASLKTSIARGLNKPLSALDIFKLELEGSRRLEPHLISIILSTLTQSNDFDFSTYRGRNSPIFEPVPAINGLPSGPEHIDL